MRCWTSIAAAALGLAVVTSASWAQQPAPAAVAQQADRYLQAQADAGFFSGAVLIARSGQTLFAKGYGLADVERNVPNGPDTRYHIASVTKIFTASLVMKLVEQGRLDPSDPICRRLAPCPDAWNAITIHHLLTHTSGIANHTVDTRLVVDDAFSRASQSPITPDQLIARVRDRPLQFRPGERYGYTNAGYAILAVIAEKAGGRPFEALMQDLILTPAGLGETGFVRFASPPPGHASGYVPHGVENAPAPHMDISWVYGAGDMYSTAGDLLKWDRALDDHKVLSQASLTRMWTRDRGDYGYGWQLMEPRNGFTRPLVYHAGGLHGFASDYLRYADGDVRIIILSNLGSSPMLAISRDLSAIVFGEPYAMPVVRRPVRVAPAILQAYAGDYQVAPGVMVAVRHSEGRLTFQATGQVQDVAIPESETKFYSRLSDTQVTFVRQPSGEVGALVIHQGGRDLTAPRVASSVAD